MIILLKKYRNKCLNALADLEVTISRLESSLQLHKDSMRHLTNKLKISGILPITKEDFNELALFLGIKTEQQVEKFKKLFEGALDEIPEKIHTEFKDCIDESKSLLIKASEIKGVALTKEFFNKFKNIKWEDLL